MYDLAYRSQRTIAKLVLQTERKLWSTELPDRIYYHFYEEADEVRTFWLYKTDALNKQLKDRCVMAC